MVKFRLETTGDDWRRLDAKMSSSKSQSLINTPLQRGEVTLRLLTNRFNGFRGLVETVKTVGRSRQSSITPLKRGVNENTHRGSRLKAKTLQTHLRCPRTCDLQLVIRNSLRSHV